MKRFLDVFQDPEVDEVLINGSAAAWSVSATGAKALAPPFSSPDALSDWLFAFAEEQGVRLDPVVGSAGGSWQDDTFRWHAVLPPLSRDGPLVSLRRHRFDAIALEHFDGREGTLLGLREVVRRRTALLIAGPTGSGKTTLLAALLREFAPTERIVSIEALPELPKLSPYAVRLVGRPANLQGHGAICLERLVAEALRLRPDRLVIGEIRAGEASAFVDATRAGHGGVMATIHAASTLDAIKRLKTLSGGLDCDGLGICVAVLSRGAPPRVETVVTQT